MFFRGQDITESLNEYGWPNDPNEFGDDIVVGDPGNPERGSEFCTAEAAIQVFEITVNVQGSVPGQPQDICSNSTNANNAQVTIDLTPSFWHSDQIPIKLQVTGSACFGKDAGGNPIKEVTVTDSQNSFATLVWDDTGESPQHGTYTITPYFVTGTISTVAGPAVNGTVFKVVPVSTALEERGGSTNGVGIRTTFTVKFDTETTGAGINVPHGAWTRIGKYVHIATDPSGAYNSYVRTTMTVKQYYSGRASDKETLRAISITGGTPGIGMELTVIPEILVLTYTPTMNIHATARGRLKLSIDGPHRDPVSDEPDYSAEPVGADTIATPLNDYLSSKTTDTDHWKANEPTSYTEVTSAIGVAGVIKESSSKSRGEIIMLQSPQGGYLDIELGTNITLTTDSSPEPGEQE